MSCCNMLVESHVFKIQVSTAQQYWFLNFSYLISSPLSCQVFPCSNHQHIHLIEYPVDEAEISNPPCFFEQQDAKDNPETQHKSQTQSKIKWHWLDRSKPCSFLFSTSCLDSISLVVEGVKLPPRWYPPCQVVIRHLIRKKAYP